MRKVMTFTLVYLELLCALVTLGIELHDLLAGFRRKRREPRDLTTADLPTVNCWCSPLPKVPKQQGAREIPITRS